MAGDLGPLWLSLRVASVATLLVVLIGIPLAYALVRSRLPGKGLVAGLCSLPLVLPPTVLGYAILQVVGRRTPIGAWLDARLGVSVVFHWSGAVLASGLASFPLFLIPARGAFEAVDRRLEDAARLLGRGEAAVFAAVTLPLAAPNLIAGAALAFARALGDFGASLMVAGDTPGRTQTASMAIYDLVEAGHPERARPLVVWVAGVAALAIVVAGRARRRP